MSQASDHKRLKKMLRDLPVAPDPHWEQVMFSDLANLTVDKASLGDKILQFFNPVSMKRFSAFAVIALVLIAVATYSYNTPTKQTVRHLNNARASLGQLQSYLNIGKFTANTASFQLVTTTFADSDDDAKVVVLVDEVLVETDAAQVAAQKIKDMDVAKEMLKEVDAVQDETVTVLAEVLPNLATADASLKVSDAIKATVATNNELQADIEDNDHEVEDSE
ncbi:hypothetical protein COV81_01445 [Candidatus Peregrinibacteria bacterium CG11_big_fil_rev_8_21_14_0_20_41_10]|nr:MAG: hypothetical protein COV81_01445 [Candidatus Peregrinibacteria bacterium CG11_big_fil_rev_8_21_14_0_20_41_10]PIZ75212.1 MAG: hypothetical protein COY06_03155 [Candidatus Peregrinibacteria bacterium CG_4_10_14_0_2_um_filter_41_8]PJC38070.1 MAG: hypothetical protein CO045_02225 [Candidatus Peregrinibacteria bacterium CG_4_9_14_0_2_um_filter_41_14]